jgi:hypothetical protein
MEGKENEKGIIGRRKLLQLLVGAGVAAATGTVGSPAQAKSGEGSDDFTYDTTFETGYYTGSEMDSREKILNAYLENFRLLRELGIEGYVQERLKANKMPNRIFEPAGENGYYEDDSVIRPENPERKQAQEEFLKRNPELDEASKRISELKREIQARMRCRVPKVSAQGNPMNNEDDTPSFILNQTRAIRARYSRALKPLSTILYTDISSICYRDCRRIS